jgi:hypothetical protein
MDSRDYMSFVGNGLSVLHGQHILRYILDTGLSMKVTLVNFFKENSQDGSIENLQTDTSHSAVEVNGTYDIPVPDGWHVARDEDSDELYYVSIATGAKVCCKSLHV